MVMARKRYELDIPGLIPKLCQEENHKMLGVITLDKELNFTDHIATICTRKIGIPRILRHMKSLNLSTRSYRYTYQLFYLTLITVTWFGTFAKPVIRTNLNLLTKED